VQDIASRASIACSACALRAADAAATRDASTLRTRPRARSRARAPAAAPDARHDCMMSHRVRRACSTSGEEAL
jgi:hypothetical protein